MRGGIALGIVLTGLPDGTDMCGADLDGARSKADGTLEDWVVVFLLPDGRYLL